MILSNNHKRILTLLSVSILVVLACIVLAITQPTINNAVVGIVATLVVLYATLLLSKPIFVKILRKSQELRREQQLRKSEIAIARKSGKHPIKIKNHIIWATNQNNAAKIYHDKVLPVIKQNGFLKKNFQYEWISNRYNNLND